MKHLRKVSVAKAQTPVQFLVLELVKTWLCNNRDFCLSSDN
jgi:hypothetical protein